MKNTDNLPNDPAKLKAIIASMTAQQGGYKQKLSELETKVSSQSNRIAWLEKVLFGVKSEKRLLDLHPKNMLQLQFDFALDSALEEASDSVPGETVAGFTRKKKNTEGCVCKEGLRFGENVEVVEETILPEEVKGLDESEYEVIDEAVTHKLIQIPSSYKVLKIIRPVVKLKASKELKKAPAPSSVIEGSYADVSFIASLIIDKILWSLPLYRQHKRLEHAGIILSRAVFTNLFHRAAELLHPVAMAQLSSILQSEVIAMDEIPIKAG